MDSGLDSHNF